MLDKNDFPIGLIGEQITGFAGVDGHSVSHAKGHMRFEQYFEIEAKCAKPLKLFWRPFQFVPNSPLGLIMEEMLIDAFQTVWSVLPQKTEFWSAIAGALVGAFAGGFIAYLVQVKALREGRKQRDEDYKQVQQAQGHAMLFKMIRIHSNFYGIHQHIEGCLEEAVQRGLEGEPWQFVLPLANPPEPVHFSSEEMGMLLAMKNDDVFNLVAPLDVVHNSLTEAVKVLNNERRALAERLKPDQTKGQIVSGVLDRDQMLTVRPRMIAVNSLIESIRVEAKKNYEESGDALDQLNQLLRDKLRLVYKLESKVKSEDLSSGEK